MQVRPKSNFYLSLFVWRCLAPYSVPWYQNCSCLSGMTELLHHNWAQAKHLQVLIRTIAQTFVDNLKKRQKQKEQRDINLPVDCWSDSCQRGWLWSVFAWLKDMSRTARCVRKWLIWQKFEKLWWIFECGGKRGNFEETVESGKKSCQSFSKF